MADKDMNKNDQTQNQDVDMQGEDGQNQPQE